MTGDLSYVFLSLVTIAVVLFVVFVLTDGRKGGIEARARRKPYDR